MIKGGKKHKNGTKKQEEDDDESALSLSVLVGLVRITSRKKKEKKIN